MEPQLQLDHAPEAAPAMQPVAPGTEPWNLAAKIGFRFACIYLALYSFPFPLTSLPKVENLFGWYDALRHQADIFVATHVFHLGTRLQFEVTGSGDNLTAYIQNFIYLVLAIAGCSIWSMLDRKRSSYRHAHEWLRLYVRLVLGATLIVYGSAKVIKSQFPDPFLWRLLEPYGDSSPMGLLWTFMGYSKAYNIFTGLVEMLGGVLLLVPRLATLGALVSIGAMANVFILNMSYDVPVKLYSLNLLLMGCFLTVPESRRFLNVFVLNRTAEPVVPPPLFRRKWLSRGLLAFQLLYLFYAVGTNIYQAREGYYQFGDGAPKPALYGIYSVDEFAIDRQLKAPLFTESSRWRTITFDRFNSIGILPGDGPVQRYSGKLDQAKKSIQLSKRGDSTWKANFTYVQPGDKQLSLYGNMDGHEIQAKLHRLDERSFPLLNRGFHWINEFPFNR